MNRELRDAFLRDSAGVAPQRLLRLAFLRLLACRFPAPQTLEWFGEALAFPTFFERYRWSLAADEGAITPEWLGQLFERGLHRKVHGAYYTPPALAEYLCAKTIPREGAVRVLDPACGAGDFLLAAFRRLVREPSFERQRHIVEQQLYGVDLMAEAVEVARLRLLLALAPVAPSAEALQTVRCQLHVGNALIGFDGDEALLAEFRQLGIAHEEATWDDARNAEGKPLRRPMTIEDVAALRPLHWRYVFPDVFAQGGFDAVVANPPWDSFKPNAKEFFEQHSDLVSKKKMTVRDFEAARTELLRDPELRSAWLTYLGEYKPQSAYFRASPHYRHQAAVIDGRRLASDTNLYKLFTERCFHLLKPNGRAGLVLPSGIYTDLGTRSLRALLLEEATITGLVGFENRRDLFEGVHRSFKFAALTFEKSPRTERFPAVFQQQELTALADFPQGALQLPANLIRQLSPDALSIMELTSEREVRLVEKMLRHPLLKSRPFRLSSEFHMTQDAGLFRSAPEPGCLPLYEGKMIWQFDAAYAPPRYWLDEREARRALLGSTEDRGQTLPYEQSRLGIRAVASNTNERSLIAALLPPRVFCGNSLLLSAPLESDPRETLFLLAVLNSFVLDSFLRRKVTANINMFYLYELPIPPTEDGLVELTQRLLEGGPRARLRAELDARVARLYGLDASELELVLDGFPIAPLEQRRAVAEAFRALR